MSEVVREASAATLTTSSTSTSSSSFCTAMDEVSLAGPDQEEFRPAAEVFKDPSDFDFLSQHGRGEAASHLARESLYVRFDPLVGGARTSVAPTAPGQGREAAVARGEEEQQPRSSSSSAREDSQVGEASKAGLSNQFHDTYSKYVVSNVSST